MPAAEIERETTGQKAAGLATLPSAWTVPFFVVLDSALDGQVDEPHFRAALEEARLRSGVSNARVLVRSNCVRESLVQRGALPSAVSNWQAVLQTIVGLREMAHSTTSDSTHWIVQSEIPSQAKGQLSNERRVRREKRDWVIELESLNGSVSDQTSIGVRRWRDGEHVKQQALSCDSPLKLSLTLKRVAMWAVQDKRRFLFEWVWDGETIYLVQMDVASVVAGERPCDLIPVELAGGVIGPLKVISRVGDKQKKQFGKLANVGIYEALGYKMPPFYLLDSPKVLSEILSGGDVDSRLQDDLRNLTQRPFVLRTDGSSLPESKREMLPRSEELRSVSAAINWLQGVFRSKIAELGLINERLVLIGHHFIPSVSSAWAGAEPGRRWVRIESLWGIPESLYWHSHDTFEVDVGNDDLEGALTGNERFTTRQRLRYKGIFIAPNSDGGWVYHQTAIPFDWTSTIKSQKWLREIAQTTRRICETIQKPVEVMWFVDTHPQATGHKVLPWYHGASPVSDTPVGIARRKIKSSQDRFLRNVNDWKDVQQIVASGTKIERVTVEPRDPELIRNSKFASDLGRFVAQNAIVVVLAGGVLSHAYHALKRAGAAVECIDLFGASEDRVEYNKVVRDKVPDQIAERGEHYQVIRLRDDALVLALRRKLVEEALEAMDAGAGTDLVGELADVQEVVRAIAKAIGVSNRQIEEERTAKLKKRGGFDRGYMLRTTTTPHSLSPLPNPESLIAVPDERLTRIVDNPSNLPQNAVYKRPDHRTLPSSTEELLVVETEVNLLGKLNESVNLDIPPNVDGHLYTASIELNRIGGKLRLTVRVRSGKSIVDPAQLPLKFS